MTPRPVDGHGDEPLVIDMPGDDCPQPQRLPKGSLSFPPDDDSSSAESQMTLRVRFSDGSADLLLTVPDTLRVSALKARIRVERSELRDKWLRLMASGRLLQDIYPLSHYQPKQSALSSKWAALAQAGDGEESGGETDGHGGHGGQTSVTLVVQCAISDAPSVPPSATASTSATAVPTAANTRRATVASTATTATAVDQQPSLDNDTAGSDVPLGARGFDRLREAGLSPEEIEELRSDFHRQRGGVRDAEDARLLEEHWMETGAQNAQPSGDDGSHTLHFFYGVCGSFFLGPLAWYFFRDPMLGTSQKMGLVIGMFVNVTLGTMRLLYT